MVDASQRPLKIPQNYIDYLDRNRIHHLLERMYEDLLINLPDDPLTFLIELLSRESSNREAPKIFIRSCNAEEEMELATMVALHTRAAILTRYDTIYDVTMSNPDLKQELQACDGKPTPQLLAKIMALRTRDEECTKNGWVITGVPENRAESMHLQMAGVLAAHAILISDGQEDSPIPPGQFQPPLNENQRFSRRLRHMLTDCGPMTRVFRSTGNLDDIREDVLEFLGCRGRETAPLILRIMLLGLPGAGCKTQARRIAAKHGLVNVHCGTAIRAAIKNGDHDGLELKEFLSSDLTPPEELVLSIVKRRLLEDDCRTRGWVLTGFPRNSFQCELMMETEVFANRIILLNVPPEMCIDRLTSRRYEPASGQVITLTEDMALPVDVAGRLSRHPDDDPRKLKQKIEERSAELMPMAGLLEETLQVVDGTLSDTEITEAIEKITVHQIPKYIE